MWVFLWLGPSLQAEPLIPLLSFLGESKQIVPMASENGLPGTYTEDNSDLLLQWKGCSEIVTKSKIFYHSYHRPILAKNFTQSIKERKKTFPDGESNPGRRGESAES